MDLKIKDVAELLSVSETTIRRWLLDGKIPAYRLNHQYRFSSMEIENWILQCKLEATKENAASFLQDDLEESESVKSGGTQHFCLYRALHQGDVLTPIKGSNKEELIRSATEVIAPRLSVDPEMLSELLLDREKMMSTGLNQGIAVPHTRDFLRKGPYDRIFVVYPEKSLPYGSLDGQDVHTLFFLFASHDKGHLQLLAKLAHLASHTEALSLFKQKPSKKALLDFVREWENAI